MGVGVRRPELKFGTGELKAKVGSGGVGMDGIDGGLFALLGTPVPKVGSGGLRMNGTAGGLFT